MGSFSLLNPLTPAGPNCCCLKGSAPYWAPYIRTERQSAQMSKIKNGGLDQHGKCKALTGSATKGLNRLVFRTPSWVHTAVYKTEQCTFARLQIYALCIEFHTPFIGRVFTGVVFDIIVVGCRFRAVLLIRAHCSTPNQSHTHTDINMCFPAQWQRRYSLLVIHIFPV